jgi:hypothetical protein
MQLVEQHLIRRDDPRFVLIDAAAFASKNLYNQAQYQIRQAFINAGTYLPYAAIFQRLKQEQCYRALPRKVSNSILIQLHKNWVGFFEATEEGRFILRSLLGVPDCLVTKTRKRAAISSSMTNRPWANGPSTKRASWFHQDYPLKLTPRSPIGTRLLR